MFAVHFRPEFLAYEWAFFDIQSIFSFLVLPSTPTVAIYLAFVCVPNVDTLCGLMTFCGKEEKKRQDLCLWHRNYQNK